MKEKTYIKGTRELYACDISFDEEIEFTEDEDGNTVLSFYLPVWFETNEVFGTDVCIEESGDWINLYAYYNVDEQCVSDILEVVLNNEDGSSERLCYRLSDAEKGMIYNAMEAYCIDCTGQNLGAFIERDNSL